jgi:hypothetical protein
MKENSQVSFSMENKEVFSYIKSIAEYIARHKIKNLILIDKGARPAYIWIKEYLRKVYPDINRSLNINFINPDNYKHLSGGFSDRAKVISQVPIMIRFALNVQDWYAGEQFPIATLVENFKTWYPQLTQRKNESTLVFDTCIHMGVAMEWLLKVLKRLGFQDVRIGIVDDSRNHSSICPDFIVTNDPKTCKSFGIESLIEKNGWFYSAISQDEKRVQDWGNLRMNIKRLVQEELRNK